MIFNIAICDDEEIHRQTLSEYLNKSLTNIEYTLKKFNSGEDLLENYPENIDILLIDIMMDGKNGIDISKQIRTFDTNVTIIFTTSFIDFAQKGYEVRAFRYLLKPIEYNDFLINILECINYISKNHINCLTIREAVNREIVKIPVNTILYIETDCRYVLIHTDNQTYRTIGAIKNFEKELEHQYFYRCHTSYLINLKKVRGINNKCALIKEDEILVSRYKIKDLKIKITNILGDLL